ncbi:MAG: hypothetical protein PHG65_10755, partial [Kiritimatiellae bacterium]|nr:hypothetical protein [Kiritimatiellia bacterium]
MKNYQERIADLTDILLRLEVTRQTGEPLDQDAAISELAEMTELTRTFHKTIFMIGNGASA